MSGTNGRSRLNLSAAVHPLQSIVDEGLAPSVRWLADGIKSGRIPGRMIGRYHRNWVMTDADRDEFLTASRPAKPVQPERTSDPSFVAAGLTVRGARRLRSASA